MTLTPAAAAGASAPLVLDAGGGRSRGRLLGAVPIGHAPCSAVTGGGQQLLAGRAAGRRQGRGWGLGGPAVVAAVSRKAGGVVGQPAGLRGGVRPGWGGGLAPGAGRFRRRRRAGLLPLLSASPSCDPSSAPAWNPRLDPHSLRRPRPQRENEFQNPPPTSIPTLAPQIPPSVGLLVFPGAVTQAAPSSRHAHR